MTHALLAHLQRPGSQNVTLIYHSIYEQKNIEHNNHVTAFHSVVAKLWFHFFIIVSITGLFYGLLNHPVSSSHYTVGVSKLTELSCKQMQTG